MPPDNEIEMQDESSPEVSRDPPAVDSNCKDASTDHAIDADMEDDQPQDDSAEEDFSQLDLPFASSTFIDTITYHLHWDTNEVMIWLGEYALSTLKEWYQNCYSYPSLRSYLIDIIRTSGSRTLFRTIKELATTHKVALRQQESFDKISEVMALKLTARAVVQINGHSFKNTRWLSIFENDDRVGLKIAAALMMDVLLNLAEEGNFSYFLVLLGGKPNSDIRPLLESTSSPEEPIPTSSSSKKQKGQEQPELKKLDQQGIAPPGKLKATKINYKNHRSGAPGRDDQETMVLNQLKAMKVLPPDCKSRGLVRWCKRKQFDTWEEVAAQILRSKRMETTAEEVRQAAKESDYQELKMLRQLKRMKVLHHDAGLMALSQWRKRNKLSTWEKVESEVERLREEGKEAKILDKIAKDANDEIKRMRRERGAGKAGRGGKAPFLNKNDSVATAVNADKEKETDDATRPEIEMDVEETASNMVPGPICETTPESTAEGEHRILTLRKRKRGEEGQGPSKRNRGVEGNTGDAETEGAA